MKQFFEADNFVGKYLAGRAYGGEVTVVQAEDFGSKEEGFVGVVCDREDGQGASGEVGLQAGQEIVAEGAVKPGEGLVEEKQVSVGHGEGSGEGHALAFAAGELRGALIEQGLEVEEVGEGRYEGIGGGQVAECFGEADVFEGVQMRQQERALGGVREVTVLGREGGEGGPAFAAGCVCVAEVEGGGKVRDEAGEGAEQGAFAAAGGAEEHRPRGGEGGFKGEG